MSRNANSRFSVNPTNIDLSRSKFRRDSSYKTSFNVGELIPFYLDEVLPGDTFQIKTSKVVRFQPLVSAPMDNIYFDTYYFFVPNRLVWEHWKQFNGENTQSAWIPTTEYSIPQITAPASTGWNIGTIADYMGIPTNVPGISLSALPFRAYALVVNEWFRDQNLQQPVNIPVDDTTIAGSNNGDYIVDLVKGGKPFIAAKYHDYFTSALPSPQKGPDVTIDLASSVGKVYTGEPHDNNGSHLGLEWSTWRGASGGITSTETYYPTAKPASLPPANSVTQLRSGFSSTGDTFRENSNVQGLFPNNLYAEMDNTSVVTINQLRMAFQIQKLYEKDARGGTRYIEILKSHFGVTSPDARLQRPEYLGGNRIPININQVVQTSETASTPQGNVAGYSLTNDSHGDFIKSFTEHGFVIGLCVARYDHTYQQGIQRMWSRRTRFDYYWPVLANIGEQAILNKEIFAQGNAEDDEVFGYQEAWADYRYKPSIVTGEMRSGFDRSLDVWHFADDYDTLPKLSAGWIQEDKTNVDRVLAVQSSVSNQLFVDFYVENETTRPMPMYSIPGLIDHH
ncbi:major capsid protein [Microvirus mar30]|uniref:Major capsid protein n=1 Tax=Microvirus mar30 TaxID=2851164 RepID=A0A8F5MIX9_9VIRU|nr:major capsid protein [Microvirus mar30]